MTKAIFWGKPDAGTQHVRFVEGEVASPEPRRGFLLYRCRPLLLLALAALAMEGNAAKKFISFGWEYKRITPEALLANADKFKDTAIDGVGIYLSATNSAGKELMFVAKGDVWERAAFERQLPLFRKIARTPHLSESFFVGLGAPVKRLAWTDDAGWANIANSMSVLGWLTRETGIRGISCDDEDYHHQSQYNRVPSDPEWDELVKIVRKRGAQVFGALFKENPDIRVLYYWILCFERAYFTSPDPVALVRAKGDLRPAFFDGILDVMPETARLINGDEHAYRAEAGCRDFYKSYFNQRSVCPRLLSSENRARFNRLTQVSFGLYYDMYVNDEKSCWYFGPVDGSRTEHLRRNFADAMRAADEYVWLWGEQYPTIAWENAVVEPRVKGHGKGTWSSMIPGLAEAMLCCKDADWGLARRLKALKAAGGLKDLNANPSCTGDGEKLPAPYDYWKPASDGGTIALDRTVGYGDASSLAVRNCKQGCITYGISNVRPGEAYAVLFMSKGPAVASVSFQKGGQWDRSREGIEFLPGTPVADGWSRSVAMVVIPPGSDKFVILLSCSDKSGEGQVWYDDIHVVKLW